MKTNQNLYSGSEKIQTQSKDIKNVNDCGLFIGDDLVCKRCGVPWASHS